MQVPDTSYGAEPRHNREVSWIEYLYWMAIGWLLFFVVVGWSVRILLWFIGLF